MSFNNQQLSSSNIYVTGDLAFLAILLGKKYLFTIGVLNVSHLQKIGDCLIIQWVVKDQ